MMVGKLLLFAFALGCTHGETFIQRCDLAQKVLESGAPKDMVADWVCLAYYQSDYQTDLKRGPDPDGSYSYGVFQINSEYWCTPPSMHNLCKMPCTKLLDADVSDDIKCAELIESSQGFWAWPAWSQFCQGKDLSKFVEGCF